MAVSEAINLKSFLTEIGKRINSNISYNLIKKLLRQTPYITMNDKKLLSIKDACNICIKVIENLGVSTVPIIQINQKNSLQALSKNTAIAILNRYISVYTWKVLRANKIDGLQSNINYKILIDDNSAISIPATITLIGGGSGGSGGYGLDGNKDASYTMNLYAGAPGAASELYISYLSIDNLSAVHVTAAGGAQKSMITKKVGGDPTVNSAGANGNNGSTNTWTGNLYDGCTLLAIKGNGGQGSGGIGISSSGGGTYTNQKTNGVTYWCDGYGAKNDWSSDDMTFGGGGGEGGGNCSPTYDSVRKAIGKNNYAGQVTSSVVVNPTAASTDNGQLGYTVLGGTGGYYNGSTWGTTHSSKSAAGLSSAGAGGKGGCVKFVTDASAMGGGGNGGNSGKVTSDSLQCYIYFIQVTF